MAKRFTDTNKWRKDFIRGLNVAHKLLWLYILDECDHAGVWHPEIDVAEFRIGMKISIEDAIQEFGNHVEIFDKGKKWFIPDFIDFQYGTLNPENRAHKSALNLLDKYKMEGLTRCLQAPMDKVKEMDKDNEKEKEKKSRKKITKPTIQEVRDYFEKHGYDPNIGESCYYYYNESDWYDSHGNQVINWKQKIRSVWFKPENKITSVVKANFTDIASAR